MTLLPLAMLGACTSATPSGGGGAPEADSGAIGRAAPGWPRYAEPSAAQTAPALGEVDATWAQGDDIPGWEDYPCEDLGEPRVRRFVNQPFTGSHADSYVSMGSRETWGCPVERPVVVHVDLQSLALDVDGEPETQLFSATTGSLFEPPAPRGQGWYTRERESDCRLNSRTPWAYIVWQNELPYAVEEECHRQSNDVGSIEAWVHTCYSRVRPDQIRGTVWAQPVPWRAGGHAGFQDWGWIVVDFEVNFPPRAGLRWDQWDEVLPILPDGFFEHPYIGYREPEESDASCGNADYDSAWPWEDITDPMIRNIVYERYRPWSIDDLPGEAEQAPAAPPER